MFIRAEKEVIFAEESSRKELLYFMQSNSL